MPFRVNVEAVDSLLDGLVASVPVGPFKPFCTPVSVRRQCGVLTGPTSRPQHIPGLKCVLHTIHGAVSPPVFCPNTQILNNLFIACPQSGDHCAIYGPSHSKFPILRCLHCTVISHRLQTGRHSPLPLQNFSRAAYPHRSQITTGEPAPFSPSPDT